jgi:NAD(P)-dependent dehydrogenase (short-subunit alcohol dehydrogenase family)
MTSTDDTPVPQYRDLARLEGRGFVVVGAGQGIGRQTSHALAQAGAKLFLIDNHQELAKEIADEVKGTPWAADARDRGEVEAAIKEARKTLGRIHGLVDIVGMAKWGELLDVSDEDWDWTFAMVLRHAFLFGQAAGNAMIEDGGGVMTFVASVSGITSAPKHAPYGAAKAGLMNWVRTLAVELGPKGIRANAVAPGGVLTPRVSQLLSDEMKEAAAKNVPMMRMAVPSDIAGAILFLSSDLASFVNGVTLIVDGGVEAKFGYATP